MNEESLERLEYLREAAEVKRMHTEMTLRAYTVGQHTCGAQLIAVELCRWNFLDPRNVLLQLLYHDMPERAIGDIPAPVKRSTQALRTLFDDLEDEVARRYGFQDMTTQFFRAQNIPQPGCTDLELAIYKASDAFDLAFFCLEDRRLGNRTRSNDAVFENALRYALEHEWVPGVKQLAVHLQEAWRSVNA